MKNIPTLEVSTSQQVDYAFSLLTEAGKTKNQATKFAFNLRGSFFLLVSFEAHIGTHIDQSNVPRQWRGNLFA